jgi:hypothetical protein
MVPAAVVAREWPMSTMPLIRIPECWLLGDGAVAGLLDGEGAAGLVGEELPVCLIRFAQGNGIHVEVVGAQNSFFFAG